MRMKIFISYRRDDTGDLVDRINSVLRTRLPQVDVFRDIEGIVPAEDYIRVLQKNIDEADVVLAIIGPGWAGDRGPSRRIDDPQDVVRREIRWRLRPGKGSDSALLPVLAGGASMPGEATLPEDIRRLARLSAVSVPGDAERGFDLGPLVNELVRRAQNFEKKLEEDSKVLEELEALAREEAVYEPLPSRPQPQVQASVPGFSHHGSWLCDVESQAPGPREEFTIEFEVRGDDSMSGRITTYSRGFFGRKSRSEALEGVAQLIFLRPPGLDVLYPVIHIDAVRGRAQAFSLQIPVQRRLGQVLHGSDGARQYKLRQTGRYEL